MPSSYRVGAVVSALGTITTSASGPSPTEAEGCREPQVPTSQTYHDEQAQLAAWRKSRDERWQLRDAAALLLGRDSRVGSCGLVPLPGKEVVIKRLDGRVYYDNCGACGNVWTCPVCAIKISRQRADELRQGITQWRAQGGVCTMIVPTVSHHSAHRLAPLLERYNEAMRWMWSGRWYQRLKEDYGVVGLVRNAECTWGQLSGWHPHSHVLVLSEKPLDSAHLFGRWERACEKFGLYTSESAWVGGFVDSDADVSEYMAKMFDIHAGGWTVAEELTLAHYKKSTQRYSPLDLLREFAATGDVDGVGALFREYASSYKGRRQLYWSKGLRLLLGLVQDEQTDEDLANSDTENDAEVVAVIPRPVWSRIVRHGLRLDLLHAVERYGAVVVGEFAEYLARLEVNSDCRTT